MLKVADGVVDHLDVVFLLPAYNPDPADLSATLASLRSQSEKADILVVDDGSLEPVSGILPEADDLHVLRLDQNQGITPALRAGVDWAVENGYRYIARIDVGDICMAKRIRVQREWMDANPRVDLIGAMSRIVNPGGEQLHDFGVPGNNAAVKRYLFKNSAFKHSTFFIRADAIARLGNYDPSFLLAQDYELLMRFARLGEIACLPSVLIQYVDHPDGLSMKRRRQQLRMRFRAQMKHAEFRIPAWYAGIARTIITAGLPLRIAKSLTKYTGAARSF